MYAKQAWLVVIACVILAACSATGAPSSSGAPAPDTAASTSMPATLPPAPTAPVASAGPTAAPPTREPTATADPTPQPTPAKPTGAKVKFDSWSFCDPSPMGLCEVAGFEYTAKWKAPRTKGVQIRVYGVTECFANDVDGAMIDGWCLRPHTELPSSALVLLAKAPASKGSVTWRRDVGDADEYDSIVLAAYDAEGRHSIFAIAYTTAVCDHVDDVECPEDY